jgi:Leucine-rich repeat (LRR) protein
MNIYRAKFLNFLLICLLLSACTSDESEDEAENSPIQRQTSSTVSITGIVAKGLVNAALVVAHELDENGKPGNELGTSETDEEGHYSIELNADYAGGPVIVEVVNQSQTTMKCDLSEGCGEGIPFGGTYPITSPMTLSTMVAGLEDEDIVNVTAVTTYASEVLLDQLADNGSDGIPITQEITRINAATADSFGLPAGTVLSEMPIVDITNVEALSAASDSTIKYSILGPAMVQVVLEDDASVSIEDAIDTFIADSLSERSNASEPIIADSELEEVFEESLDLIEESYGEEALAIPVLASTSESLQEDIIEVQELVANADTLVTNQNTSANIDVLANDVIPENSVIGISSASAENGVVDFTSNPIKYTPNSDFSGTDTITYTIKDESGKTASSTVSVTVNQVIAPIANEDSLSVDEGSSATIDVLANDTSSNGEALSVINASATNGAVDISAYPIRYTPNSDFHGSDTLSYTIRNESGGMASSSVAITVNPVVDSPVVDPDSDLDGLTDLQEQALGTNPNEADTDNDGLSDGEEVNTHSTSPTNSDSDSDGLSDYDEVLIGANPNATDSDLDGLTDSEEAEIGTNLIDSDSDADGLLDGEEVNIYLTDPLNSDSDSDSHIDSTDNCPTIANDQTDTDLDGIGDACEVVGSIVFTDANLAACVSEQYSNDTLISDVATLSCHYKDINDASGIEHLTELTNLNLAYNNLVTLDVSNNTALTILNVASNDLLALDVSNNTALTYLGAGSNELSAINVSNNTALTSFYASSNNLSTIDVSNNSILSTLNVNDNNLSTIDVSTNNALTRLEVGNNTKLNTGNSLSTLDISNNTALTTLNVRYNDLSMIDVSTHTALTDLDVGGNNLSTIDVTNNLVLTDLNVHNNSLSNLDLTNNSELVYLDVFSSGLSSLNISNNAALDYLDAGSNSFSAVDLSNNTALAYLDISYNHLSTLDLSNNTALTDLNIGANSLGSLDLSANIDLRDLIAPSNVLTTLDVSNNTLLGGLDVSYNNLSSLDVSTNTALVHLHVDNNNLSALNVSNNTELTSLHVESNNLTSLNVSTHSTLEELNVGNNNLSVIDVSNNVALTTLDVAANSLSAIDVSSNIALTTLEVGSNNLLALDISNNTALNLLRAGSAGLSTLDISNNVALTELYVDRNNLSTIDVSNNTALTDLNLYQNSLSSIDVSNNTALTDLVVSFNSLSTLDVSSNTALTLLYAASNNLSTINVDANLNLSTLKLESNPLTAETTTYLDNLDPSISVTY